MLDGKAPRQQKQQQQLKCRIIIIAKARCARTVKRVVFDSIHIRFFFLRGCYLTAVFVVVVVDALATFARPGIYQVTNHNKRAQVSNVMSHSETRSDMPHVACHLNALQPFVFHLFLFFITFFIRCFVFIYIAFFLKLVQLFCCRSP